MVGLILLLHHYEITSRNYFCPDQGAAPSSSAGLFREQFQIVLRY